ncbi:MAG: hypothetical protein CME81_10405 [Halomonas sp.]|nr:hypothetical protein [Halomonas sp.]
MGVATNTAPIVDFAMAGALDDKGQLTPAAKKLLDKDPQEFVRKAAQKGALIDKGLQDESPVDSSEEEDRPKVRVEAGLFFDGTGNNRNNTQTYQQQVDKCLTANVARAISEEQCSSELSLIMKGSYHNAEANASKLERMYQQGRFESGGMNRWVACRAFKGLELHDGKLSRTVLMGRRGAKPLATRCLVKPRIYQWTYQNIGKTIQSNKELRI